MRRRPRSRRAAMPLAVCCALTCLASCVTPARAQPLDPAALPAADALSDEAGVVVVTIGRGDAPHTLFGHTAVVVTDPATGFAAAFNYGTFDFGEGFLLKFLGGELDYYLSVAPSEEPFREAIYFGRGYVAQTLSLSPTQTRELYRAFRLEAQPEHRSYRYRFLDQNCATKVVDAMDRALGDAVAWPEAGDDGARDATYRDLLRGHLRDKPWTRLGIDLLLGQPADRATTPKQRGFLPVHLMELLDGTLIDQSGAARPAVAGASDAEFVGLSDATRRGPFGVMLGVLGVAAAASLIAWRWPRATRWPLRVFDGVLLLTASLVGVVVTVMWAWSAHDVIGPNLNLLWACPTHAVAAAWVLQRPGAKALRVYLGVAGAIAALTTIAWPLLPQAMPLAAWPVAAALAVRCITRSLAADEQAKTADTVPSTAPPTSTPEAA